MHHRVACDDWVVLRIEDIRRTRLEEREPCWPSDDHSTWQRVACVRETNRTDFASVRARGSVVERPIRIGSLELTVVIWEGPGFDSRRVQFFISGIYGPFYLSTLEELQRA